MIIKNNIDIFATINSAVMIAKMYDFNFERFVGLYKEVAGNLSALSNSENLSKY